MNPIMDENAPRIPLPIASIADVLEAKISMALAVRRGNSATELSVSSRQAPSSKHRVEIEAMKTELFLPRTQEGMIIREGTQESKARVQNDTLLKQITGKKAAHNKIQSRQTKENGYRKTQLQEDSDEEEGRSALGKRKTYKPTTQTSTHTNTHPTVMQQNQNAAAEFTIPTHDILALTSHRAQDEGFSAAELEKRGKNQAVTKQRQKRPNLVSDADDGSLSPLAISKIRRLNSDSAKESSSNISTSALNPPNARSDRSSNPPISETAPLTCISKTTVLRTLERVKGDATGSIVSDIDIDVPSSIPQPSNRMNFSASAPHALSKSDKKKEKKKLAKKARKERDRLLKAAETS